MGNRWQTLGVIGLLAFGYGCEESAVSTAISTSTVEVIPSQKELQAENELLMARLMESEDFDLQLNMGEKWLIAPESLKVVLKVKQQVYVISGNMENYTVSSYNMLGSEVFEYIDRIGNLENSDADQEYQKVIKEMKNQCAFLAGSDLKGAQLAVINLSSLLDEVPKYFETSEN